MISLGESGGNFPRWGESIILEAPEILWTWLETSPGVTTGSIRPVWIMVQLMRQNASERPVKEPKEMKKSDVLVTNMMASDFEKNDYKERETKVGS